MGVLDDLKNAFAGESQANRRYLAFAAQADKDGFPQVAKLFRAAAAAETVHAHAHLRAMDGVKSTVENLMAALDGEVFEYEKMYPPYLENARKEAHRKAEFSFQNALAVEETHARLYREALASVREGNDLEGAKIHVCSVCGHTVAGDAPDVCPVCGAKHDHFFEVH